MVNNFSFNINFLPIASYLLVKNISLDSREDTKEDEPKEENVKQWMRKEVIKDYRFYIINMNMLAMPSIAFICSAMVCRSQNPIHHRIAQIHIRGRHIDLGT